MRAFRSALYSRAFPRFIGDLKAKSCWSIQCEFEAPFARVVLITTREAPCMQPSWHISYLRAASRCFASLLRACFVVLLRDISGQSLDETSRALTQGMLTIDY